MVGHLQVFVLSDWFTVNQPNEYSETTEGLRWLIPRQKLPWRKDGASISNHVYLAEEKLAWKLSHGLATGWSSHEMTNQPIDLNFMNSSYMHNISIKSTPYGLPLNSSEYFIYFLVSIYFIQLLYKFQREHFYI
jgi:hypothetical protein